MRVTLSGALQIHSLYFILLVERKDNWKKKKREKGDLSKSGTEGERKSGREGEIGRRDREEEEIGIVKGEREKADNGGSNLSYLNCFLYRLSLRIA